ncbi:hypothetical protein A9W98_10590 [Mycobacterium gordonae]|nr:hypothetical protein A9W98_10590 [Mycobacterium gordonae]
MALHPDAADTADDEMVTLVEETQKISTSTELQAFDPSMPVEIESSLPYPSTSSSRNPFPPIADYAFLSDWETTCLISPAGSVEWLCVPRPDSPSVFGAILDRSAGHFRLGPYGVSVPSARR